MDEMALRSGIKETHVQNREDLFRTLGKDGKDRVYPDAYERLWKDLLEQAGTVRSIYRVEASHFLIGDSKYESYLRPLREHYLVHLVQEGFALPGDARQFSLYAFDYAACTEFQGLGYGLPRLEDARTWEQLIYDPIIARYALAIEGKKPEELYRCERCNEVYSRSSFGNLPGHIRLKHCLNCGGKLQGIMLAPVGRPGVGGQFSPVEREIIFVVHRKSAEGYVVKAIEIAEEANCSFQKVAWFARLHPEWIARKKSPGVSKRTPYLYYAVALTNLVTL